MITKKQRKVEVKRPRFWRPTWKATIVTEEMSVDVHGKLNVERLGKQVVHADTRPDLIEHIRGNLAGPFVWFGDV